MPPYSVMIVDDERLIRDGLMNSVAWKQLGYRVVATASDGYEAVEAFRDLRPQVILLDIKMSRMDGLQALEIMKQESAGTEVILLSGYDEFAYAKKGIQLGAFDYVLKIHIFHELEGVLKRLRDKLDAHVQHHRQQDQLAQLKNNYMFLEFIRGRSPIGVQPSPQPQMVAVVSVWRDEPEPPNVEWGRVCRDVTCITGIERAYVHTIFLSEGDDRERFLRNIDDEIDALERSLQAVCPECEYGIGIGTIKTRIADIPGSYREAMKALDYARCSGFSRSRTKYADWPRKAESTGNGQQAGGLDADWMNWVYSGDEANLTRWMGAVFEHACVTKDIQLADVRSLSMQVLMQFEKAMRDNQAEAVATASCLEELQQYDSLHDLERYMLAQCSVWSKRLHAQMLRHKNKSIAIVKEYVDQLYTTNIRMEEVAQHFYLSPGYLSAKFKELTGKPYSKYIIDKRLARSCELLAGTALKVYEIAEQVGYADEKHFSKLFTRYMKMSPRDYRARHRAAPPERE